MVPREMQIKPQGDTVTHLFTWPEPKPPPPPNAGEDGGQRDPVHCCQEYKRVQPVWKTFVHFLQN